jgi:hypothetical protein
MSSAFILSSELAEVLDRVETDYESKFKPIEKADVVNIDNDEVDMIPKTDNKNLVVDVPLGKHSWTYLDKDAPDSTINYEFGLCSDTNGKLYKVYICPYIVNTECQEPFLQYLLERGSSAEYNFPYFHFSCPDSMNTNSFSFSGIIKSLIGNQQPEPDEPEDELSQGQTYFVNQCLMRILELIAHDDDHLDPNLITDMYKGFVEYGTNNIYAFFDFTGKTLAETKTPRSWAIIDEIINNQSTLGYKINKDVYSLFYQNPKLIYIDDKDGYHIDPPIVLYLCKKEGDHYVNVVQDDPQVFSLYNERIEHPNFGDFYIFSLKPLESNTNAVSQLKRFVGFTPNPTYILKDLALITRERSIESEPKFMGFKIPTMLLGKVPEKKEESVQEDEEEPIKDEESVQEEEASQKEKEIEELNNIDNTSIYFKENGVSYWCIKSKLYFTEY